MGIEQFLDGHSLLIGDVPLAVRNFEVPLRKLGEMSVLYRRQKENFVFELELTAFMRTTRWS